MRALVRESNERGEIAGAVGNERGDEEIRVDEILGVRIEIEYGKHRRLKPQLPLTGARDIPPEEREGFTEAHRDDVLQVPVVDVVAVYRREMRPAGVSKQRFE